MAKKMLIDATHSEETRVVVVDGNKVDEFDFESKNKRQLAGNIYLAKVTRVEPSLQAAFVDYGGNRHGFLAFSEIHPDYYQIPVADREALIAEELAYAEALREHETKQEEAEEDKKKKRRSRRSRAASVSDATRSEKVSDEAVEGMETIDLTDEAAQVPVGDDNKENEDHSQDPEIDGEGHDPEAHDAEDQSVDPVPSDETAPDADIEPDPASDTASDAGENDDMAAEEQAPDTDAQLSATTQSDAQEDEIEEPLEADEHNSVHSSESQLSEADENLAIDLGELTDVAELDNDLELPPLRKPRLKRYKIQEVIKMRQIILVQVVKEERGNKGAALTTYLSLAGRYCVLMPNTARGGGISRKITNVADRKKLKEIANSIEVPNGAGLIIRTAGARRTKTEVKRDYEYLMRLWEQIRELTLKSIAPAKIYEEGDLIKRSIRDLFNRDLDEVLVEGEAGYQIARDFMSMIMPHHKDKVKEYKDRLPLFSRYQVESYLSSMFNPVVQLKSGGYIVIGITEALVAIDVNSGRATKEGSIEETALKTNLEAADEVARQLRLRDLAGLIVIDFIDMDERRNNSTVEKRMKEQLKSDRARIQVGGISGFGLMEMSRQRLRPGMLEATTQSCPHCHGTGLIRSEDNLALTLLREVEEEAVRGRNKEVIVRCPVSVANFLMNQKREHIAQLEARYGVSIQIEASVHMISPEYEIEKLKVATRRMHDAVEAVVSMDSTSVEVSDETRDTDEDASTSSAAEGDEAKEDAPKKRRRRRRRRKQSDANETQHDASHSSEDTVGDENASDSNQQDGSNASSGSDTGTEEPSEIENAQEDSAKETKPKRTPRKRAPRKKAKTDVSAEETQADAGSQDIEGGPSSESADKTTDKVSTLDAGTDDLKVSDAEVNIEGESDKAIQDAEADKTEKKPVKKRKRSPKKKVEKASEETGEAGPEKMQKTAPPAEDAKPDARSASPEAAPETESVDKGDTESASSDASESEVSTQASENEADNAVENKPKRRGWWSRV